MDATSYECDICNKLCKSERGLAAHRQNHFKGGDSEASQPVRLVTCNVCFRQYKSDKNLQKHLLSHSNGTETLVGTEAVSELPSTTANSSTIDEDFWTDDLIDCFQNDYMDNLPDTFIVEAEKEEVRREGTEENNCKTQKKKRAPALVHCSECKPKRGFNSIETYLTHRKRHAFKDACDKAPSVDRAKAECLLLADRVLTKLEGSNLTHSIAQEIKATAALLKTHLFSDAVKTLFEFLCETFMSCFTGDSEFFLLSKLTEVYLSNVAKRCVDVDVRNHLLSLLSAVVVSPTAPIFLASVMREFAQVLLTFILRTMNEGESVGKVAERFANRKENTETEEFKQTMHYVGGANVKKILRIALRLRNPNEKSLIVIDTIRSNFLIVDLAEESDEKLMAWTEAQDRGGLLKINRKVLDFFVELGKVVDISQGHQCK